VAEGLKIWGGKYLCGGHNMLVNWSTKMWHP
jgi:hypothetical protein